MKKKETYFAFKLQNKSSPGANEHCVPCTVHRLYRTENIALRTFLQASLEKKTER